MTASEGRNWYRDAVIYELHVRAFADSDGDGKGDFRGLLGKLDYLADLGVTALWLLPFYPSPLRDDGYDIADYRDVHPAYGTLDDCKRVIAEAHRRGLRVITELVANHTSDQHPWFQRARRAPVGSSERDYYVWSDTPDRYAEARIIFTEFETSNHGDLHLGQILDTGDDIAIIDLEGEPSRSLGARRLKRSPLVDVAGMLRSFSYAASTAALEAPGDGPAPEATVSRRWEAEVTAAFLAAYTARAEADELVPRSAVHRQLLLRALLLERCLYEVRYELAARPEWAAVPLHGLLALA